MGDDLDKTNVVSGDTLELQMSEAGKTPPALILLMGPANQVGRQWSLTKKEMLVGRAVDAHVFVDDRSVSKSHAKLIIRDEEVFVVDLNSTNGTEVHGNRVPAQKETKN
jgi:two-component system cell cycle response regulator